MKSDLLFELGTEELPSASVKPLADALTENLTQCLEQAGLKYGQFRPFATPRRLAVIIEDVELIQSSQTISRRGPAYAAGINAEGEPTPALIGFAKSLGVGVNELIKITTDKGEWWGYESIKPGARLQELLPEMVKESVARLPLTRAMRWGSGDDEFARPVHWAVLLLGSEVISAEVLGVNTDRFTYGHRFHHPQAIRIEKPADYESGLQKAFVLADFKARREQVAEQVQELAKQHGLSPVMPDELLDEVTSIVEWPNALLADFDPEFLEVPSEALIAAMQVHQKCFALKDKENQLVPHFITVANIKSTCPQQVVEGNEKVMRARLSDAAFFFRQDKKQRLESRYLPTANVIFESRLGTLQDKSLRIQVLMEHLAEPLHLNLQQCLRAALLSKCDLMTGMVGEFPELQGIMGYHYALHDEEDPAVALALKEQYMPRFASDELPQTDLGVALSLADRIDTLAGIFAIGKKPTGVKDPFKLRRHALAVVRILANTPAALNLSTLITSSLHTYQKQLKNVSGVLDELKPFILERMQSFYQKQGISADIVQAVRAREDDWLYDVDKRIKALLKFIDLPEASSLSQASKRVNNILNQASYCESQTLVDEKMLKEPAEKTLYGEMKRLSEDIKPLYRQGDYIRMLKRLADLRNPVDAFFDQVMVMVDDPALKANRLCLLANLRDLLQSIADISLLTSIHEQ
ncbi:glycine--tRNA ligase subunit beta [Legionella londiniensis]|uniref:glycine--tRNA ligase subunit beta n=1 Tax=Legionella londiniensis TaxID=45068 RepID=UPI00399D0A3D